MKTIHVILTGALLFLSAISTGQEKYAILIGGPIDEHPMKSEYEPSWFELEFQDFFWTDIFFNEKPID